MSVYKAPESIEKRDKNIPSVFLAGSIDFKLPTNWRRDVINQFKKEVYFFDPTREDHQQLSDIEMKEHIQWEHEALEEADNILLKFLPEAKSPISLVELGLYVNTAKLIVVCPDEFYQRRYIKALCKRYETPFFNSLDKGIEHLKALLK